MKRYAGVQAWGFFCLVFSYAQAQETISSAIGSGMILKDARQAIQSQLKTIEAQLNSMNKLRNPLKALRLTGRAKELKERLNKLP